MKSSKRKRCTTNEGTQLVGLLPLGVATASSSSTSNLLNETQIFNKMMHSQKEQILETSTSTDSSTTTAATSLLMLPNQAVALIKGLIIKILTFNLEFLF